MTRNPLRRNSKTEETTGRARRLAKRAAKTAEPLPWRFRRPIAAAVVTGTALFAGAAAYAVYRLKRSRDLEPEPGAFEYPGSESTRTHEGNGSVQTPDPVPSATAPS